MGHPDKGNKGSMRRGEEWALWEQKPPSPEAVPMASSPATDLHTEVDKLTRRLRREFDDVPPAEVDACVARAKERTGTFRIADYKALFIERWVRVELKEAQRLADGSQDVRRVVSSRHDSAA